MGECWREYFWFFVVCLVGLVDGCHVIRSIDEEWEFSEYPTVTEVAEICGVTPQFVSAIYAQHSRYSLAPDQVLDRGTAIRIARLVDEVA